MFTNLYKLWVLCIYTNICLCFFSFVSQSLCLFLSTSFHVASSLQVVFVSLPYLFPSLFICFSSRRVSYLKPFRVASFLQYVVVSRRYVSPNLCVCLHLPSVMASLFLFLRFLLHKEFPPCGWCSCSVLLAICFCVLFFVCLNRPSSRRVSPLQ